MVVGVLVEITNKNVDKTFDYHVPPILEKQIKVGIRVVVPFGKMTLEGFVLEIKDQNTDGLELRDVIEIVDENIVLNEELLELGRRMQKTTISSLMSCYQTMLPKALKAHQGNNVSIKYDYYYSLNSYSDDLKITKRQQEMIDLFHDRGSIIKKELLDFSSSSFHALLEKGVLKEEKKEHYRTVYKDIKNSKKELTPLQKRVVQEVISSDAKNFLLYGVTGSGKTEVYMEIIDYYLKQGKSSIVLVPEISLTPQMVQRFRERFGDKIAALHSALSDGEKYDEWRRIYKGEADIVIGARSAIFAPLKQIGVIIMDEEHSDSYKQSDPSPRYHARDIAFLRANYHHASVVLGSATPSLESMARAQKGVYTYLSLPVRVNGKDLPNVEIVDMNQEPSKGFNHFSRSLIQKMQLCLERKEQIILLLNRRGYSSFVTCKECGFVFKCPNCDISLTYHKSSNTLRCHYCGYGEKVYQICPKCGKKALQNYGVGTQKIEEELNKLFPSAKVLRMDYDTTSRKGMHEELIRSFQEDSYDILLGTQMVAKGLDFPRVTLVGVINADTSLNIPDFRSSENTFSLLNQVAGRSGRADKLGSVVIQTFNPDHYAISMVKQQDYVAFYHKEMMIRRELHYPPYYYLCMIRISGKNPEYLFDESLKIKERLEKTLFNTELLGPSSSGLFKINNIYHYHIILKYKKEEQLYLTLGAIVDHYKANSRLKVDIDFNPSQML